MPPRRQAQAAPAAWSTANIYRSVNDIFSDFIVFFKDLVSGEIDNGPRNDRNNVLHSALLRWNAQSSIPVGESETEARSREFRTWLAQFIIDRVIYHNFCVWASTKNTFPLHVARQIDGRAFQFNNITVLNHLFKYRTGITTEMKLMAVKSSKNVPECACSLRHETSSTWHPMQSWQLHDSCHLYT